MLQVLSDDILWGGDIEEGHLVTIEIVLFDPVSHNIHYVN